jgi:hypothetical protein
MIYLDSSTDSILPYGLKGTPFETVFKALQAVASTVWPVDAAELRAAIGWGWYLDNNLEELILLSAGKQYIQNILISEQVPLIKSTQTQEELVDLLYRWKSYKPTFDKLEGLYIPYAVRVDIRPITDEATQEVLPVTDIHNAFYVVLTDIDWSRPLTLSEAALIAERATPMGSHPIAVFQFEETTNVYPQLACGDVNFYTGTFEPAAEPTPPPPPPPEPAYSYIVFDTTTGTIVHSIVDEGMITVYETGVRTESFYFTMNGRNETENTDISHADIPVYLEDGTSPAADTPYNGSAVMAFMDVDGNTKQADGESLYLDEGVLRLDAPDTDEGEQWSALVEYIPEVVLKVKWGDTVNVPSGYKVSEVRTFVGYANKSYYGDYSQWEQLATYEGKNKYFDNIDGHNLIITSTNSATDSAWPLIVASQGYQLNNTTGPHMQVLDFGAGYKNATSYWGFSDVQTNGTDAQAGDFSVLLRGQTTSTISNAINSGYPVRFLWFIIDGEGNAVWHKTPEAFRVPNSLWSFVNGVFSWLGNSEDTSSLAWYYKHDWELFEWEEFDGAWIYIHCVRDENPEPPAPSFDSATGTISSLTLPTAHSGSYTNVTFDTLRYYVKGTTNGLSSTYNSLFGQSGRYWYYGTIEWTDESLGNLSSLILVNPTSSNYIVQQTVFRIIFIYDNYISGFHPYDTEDSSENVNQITAYSYNNGVHSITFYSTQNWLNSIYTGRIQFRYLDGTTTFNGLDAYDLILVNNGALSKATTTDRYDMYNAWGGQISIKSYYPQPPAPSELTAYFTTSGAAYEYDTQINQGGGSNLYDASGANLYYDSSKAYTITGLYNAAGELLTFGDGDSMGNNSTYLYYNRGINLKRVWAHRITYTVS